MYYTYVHYKPSGELFYVGKGKNNRAYEKVGRSDYWNNIVSKYGGFKVEILARWETEKEAFEHEIFLIDTLKSLNIILANLTLGGEGSSGTVPSIDTRLKMSKASKGRPKSDLHKLRISESKKGKKFSPEHLANMSKAQLGKKPTDAILSLLKSYRHLAWSEEAQEKKSLKTKGVPRPYAKNTKPPSKEACSAGGKLGKGRIQSPEHVAKRMEAKASTLLKRKTEMLSLSC